ncbi:FlgD immunoglobulin-like domain containing protein [Oceanispirochaeta sp. M1]|uniref:FlgD immunoglobulin-like domain containing protein n=2 Tax=unclassified Oceanispirochaeta TaxID=2635722 RepID=UPI000E093C35|nr:FlgD immunoglobulin-like domain containing protein [Oceanispirochaeta sp. M1]MBF9015638.1 OmpA family protein [Oceanispirochaeta sp. M2]NPD73412.1 OmpA family protein [Oceanispirochaeta sp. M1]RDG30886.1 flagellar motor protein MotB [Oceanispirochaeta sp. M1]
MKISIKLSLIILLLLIMPFGAFAESSGELAYPLYSPLFLGGGASVTNMDSPQSAGINPAASGNFQRIILDLNYINLAGWDDNGMGHAINTALAVPSKYGVFTGNLHFLTTDGLDAPDMDFGTFGSMDFGFSKEIYKNLYTGFSLSGAIGSGMDWGLGLNLGVIHTPGTIGKFKNFRWGASLNKLGKGYTNGGSYLNAIPNNLTLQLGAGFDIIDKENFNWALNSDLGFPTFTDIKFELGQVFTIQKNLKIFTSSSVILSDTINGNFQTIIPSVGLSYNFSFKPKDKEQTRQQTSEVEFQAAGAPLYNSVGAIGVGATIPFGIRDANPPVITHEYKEPIYISPNLNGVQDELDLPYLAEDERFIMGYTFSIYDDEGTLVKVFNNKDERPENESFKNIFDRMFSAKVGTTLPETFRWDGVMDSGEIAADGTYSFKMAFWDDNDNLAESELMILILDTVAPEVTVVQADGLDLIFSPDGDGNKDSLGIKQSGSEELLWEAKIENQSASAFKNYIIENGYPADFVWDGKDDNEKIVPDGVYRYFIESTDLAGNYGSGSLENILINTEQPPVNLTINNAWLSPGNTEGSDNVVFGPDIPVTSGIVEWELQVQDLTGRMFWSYNSRQQGVLEVPKSINYDGDAGVNGSLAEGKYRGFLTIKYQNGYNPEAYSPAFTVDTTAPVGKVSGDLVLSPDGDGFKDSLTLSLETSEEDYWEGFIRDGDNQIVRSYFWRGKADPILVWDGRDQDGRPVTDGKYSFTLEAYDKAGNRGISAPHRFSLDTREMSVQITVSDDAFSPNNNGTKDEVRFYTIIDNPSEIESWTLDVLAAADSTVVKSWKGSGAIKEYYSWMGESESGAKAADGFYSARLSVVYAKGDRPEAVTGVFEKDTVAPVLTVEADKTLFSPDGDGSGDSIMIRQSTSKEAELTAVMMNDSGETIRTWFWSGTPGNFDWDGTDENGNIAADGVYHYKLSTSDAAGNSAEKSLRNIEIDTASTPVYLTAKNAIFSPMSEEFSIQSFTVHVGNTKGIEGWNLAVKTAEGQAVRTINGESSVPELLEWDGRDDAGKLLEGNFIGELTVHYKKGNRPQARSREFLVDNSAPSVVVGISPVPFSPDDDNVSDELKIALTVQDLSPIRDWQMTIKDPKGNDFISFGGRGRPSERIIWDGRSRQGELVQSAEDYPYEIRVTDFLGHSTVESGKIPVDILVIRDGNRLKVQISNITFQPYKASLVASGEQGDKNQEILKRLAEVLKKYGSYKILVEGHAVSEYYDNPVRAAREEKEELQPLSLSRAAVVKESLSKLGIQDSRMDVAGKGGTDPIVPHSDLENRWKNRRVEFILIK